ncbi:hypothetical protein [Companilactobacillus sp. HBUAS56257]|uniref:hypothetical protein n=1 Tax=Companilactobacillus sp. HBUAS56257 TaxID=3109360 RepID=UPI002FF282AD
MKIKNFKVIRLGLLFGTSLGLIFAPISTVKAWKYETYNTKNVYGVTYQKYWPTSSLTNWQKQQINDEIYRWSTSNNTGVYTKLNIGIGENQSQSILDFYYSPQGANGPMTAATTFFDLYGKNVSFTYSNWSCATVRAWGKVYNQVNDATKIEVWAHETGHGFGLAHNDDPAYRSVMRSTSRGDYDGPTANDLSGINHLY